MSTTVVIPDAVRGYGASAASTGVAIAGAGAINAGANTLALIPVFGLIGQEFLASFIGAQTNHLASVSEVAAVHLGTAAAAIGGAADFENTDTDGASGITRTVGMRV
ncbi:hypothetical protein [Gordonia sp. (in: high G+C Gram-positive bacteria)]|uniref:hypothetical protein n=1 Tax=Gordonia sp. (in: high G+C Gram-positive bacteria) TaxID=84139 RepID=UPI001DEBC60F|nr:hypothetical protein [Gordonia sp. (in: high G+C Gram-positive bacteria)]MCB1296849.1 hypothetical protein [Gordonia sp. (in: high G+C Gram-positive bacteria)]HMS74067.1 hypothetical protein [Gordonia sp. (in: high G+C Gram-positive bacteria)]HQV18976.1 hypothetical protein [Gordonia sp. (in: high G+C Gram-positive bacteria)]